MVMALDDDDTYVQGFVKWRASSVTSTSSV